MYIPYSTVPTVAIIPKRVFQNITRMSDSKAQKAFAIGIKKTILSGMRHKGT